MNRIFHTRTPGALLGLTVALSLTGCGAVRGVVDVAGGAAKLTVHGTKASIDVAGAGLRATGHAIDTAGKGVQLVGRLAEQHHRDKLRREQRRVETARAAAQVHDAEADLLKAEQRLAVLREQVAQR